MTKRTKRTAIITTIATAAIAAILGIAPELVAPVVNALLALFGTASP